MDFVAYHGRTLDTVTQAEMLRSFHGVREDLARFETAAGMVGSVRALSGGDEADRRVFNLLYNGLDTLEARDSGFGAIEAAFGLKLSMLAGYAPQLDVCLGCGMNLDEARSRCTSPPTTGACCARSAAPRPATRSRSPPAHWRAEDPDRKPHPRSTRASGTRRERPQGGPLPRPRPRPGKRLLGPRLAGAGRPA